MRTVIASDLHSVHTKPEIVPIPIEHNASSRCNKKYKINEPQKMETLEIIVNDTSYNLELDVNSYTAISRTQKCLLF